MKKVFLMTIIASSIALWSCNGANDSDQEVKTASTAESTEVNSSPDAVDNTEIPETTISEATEEVPETTAESVETKGKEVVVNTKPVHLTAATFKSKVFNYESNPSVWTFEGDKPCIIDFYADWCKPCKLVAPIMDELAEKYAGQIDVYKVDTQVERELAQVFGIRSIPSVLFCPAEGKPQMTQGALPKETFEQVITDFLLAEKTNEQ